MNLANVIGYALWVYLCLDITIAIAAFWLAQYGYFVAFLGFSFTTLGLILEAWKWL